MMRNLGTSDVAAPRRSGASAAVARATSAAPPILTPQIFALRAGLGGAA
jgi:hypothetical protein